MATTKVLVTTTQSLIFFPSAARTTSVDSDWFRTTDLRGLTLYLDITAASGTTPTLDIKLQGQDPISNKAIDIPAAAFAQQTGIATLMLTLYPGIDVSPNSKINGILPTPFRASVAIAGTTPSFTFSLGAVLHP